MPYTVAGTLKLPETGQPAAGVILKFVALQSISPVLDRSESVIITSSTGAYSIQLEYNTYSVFATLYDNKPINCGQIVLNSTLAIGLDLPTLLNGGYSEPTTPSWIVELQRLANVTTSAAQAAAASAAASSTSAASAAASAAQASQISGLSTVAEAIGLASLPLPDVWAPLSDSLRMITGYGREVKVGEDVVSRMVNFSRSTTATYIGKDGLLKTAAANEPRFEKAGLLIEGQSTNLVPWSSGYNGETAAWTALNYSMSKRPDGVLITPAAGVLDKFVRVGYNLFPDLPDRPLSMTVEVKGNGYDMIVLGFRASYVASIDNGIGVSLVDGTVKRTNHGLNVTRFEPLPDGFVRITVSTPSYTSTTYDWRSFVVGCGSMSEPYKSYSAYDADGVKGVIVRNAQLEALPFASSYIPTNGAAVTRAADVCWIPMAGNSNNRMSFALTISGFKPIGGAVNSRALWYEYDAFTGPYFGVRYRDGEIVGAHGGQVSATAYASGLSGLPAAVIAISPGVKSRVGQYTATQKVDSLPATPAGNLHIGSFKQTGQELWGHVRNLRIWHRSLTEDQIKAIA